MLVIYWYMNSYKSLYIVFLYHFIINTSTVSLFIINSSNKAHSRQSYYQNKFHKLTSLYK